MFEMSLISDLCKSFEKILNIYENNENVDTKTNMFIKFLQSRRFDPIADFGKEMDWFNVSQPLILSKHLKDKVVLLDFFTYCCINCMHILPFLNKIESNFTVENGFVVIGVHCAKFSNEQQSSNIQSAINRYDIQHPVVKDNEFKIWTSCNIRCWPSLLLLDPDHKPICLFQGEGNYDLLNFCVDASLKYFKSIKKISRESLPIQLNYHVVNSDSKQLRFPGKIASYFDENFGVEKLALSDTGNNRILIIHDEGTVDYIIGNGNSGLKDGSFTDCEFNKPCGVTFMNNNKIFVADTENHAIRLIDLEREQVSTVAGTGFQGHDKKGGRTGKDQVLSSPWDVVVFDNEVLLVAMAGTHQIWAYFLAEKTWWKSKVYLKNVCVNIAGSGREENRNNNYPNSASFAQPSGICLDEINSELYVADSESSTIRKISLTNGTVSGVVGGDIDPSNLFAFGDIDGKSYHAKLQHPLGVTILPSFCGSRYIFVVDSYNHKIKYIKDGSKEIHTLKMNANNQGFNEPHGLCASRKNSSKLYVCDTNNHCIKIVHLLYKDNLLKGTIADFEIKLNQKPILLKKIMDFSKMHKVLDLSLDFELADDLKFNAQSKQDIRISYLKFDEKLQLTDNKVFFKIENNSEFLLTNNNFIHIHLTLNLCNNEICICKNILLAIQLNFNNEDNNMGEYHKKILIKINKDCIQLV